MVKQTRFFQETTCDHGFVRGHPTETGRCKGGEVVELHRCKHGRAVAHRYQLTTGPGEMTTTFRCRGPK